MIVAWMLYALLVGAFAAVGALAGEWACRALRWPTRWAWVGAMLLIDVLVAVAPFRAPEAIVAVTYPGSPDVAMVATLRDDATLASTI